jgi:polyisoprenoid-binding protein YceI
MHPAPAKTTIACQEVSVSYPVGVARVAILIALFAPHVLPAQTVRWTIDAKTSLARWEVSPHSNQLRATTCPEDPSWTPGEGSDHGSSPRDRLRHGERKQARPLCTEALDGSLTTTDTAHWSDVHGTIVLRAEHLTTGLQMRDRYARQVILETSRYPEIRFTIDSLTNVLPGDTLRGHAMGGFELHGVRQPMTVPLKAWRSGQDLRVVAEFEIPAQDLTDRYGMSKPQLGMAVYQGIWKSLEIRIDVVLHEVPFGAVTAVR